MNLRTVLKAKQEAKRFLERVEAYEAEIKRAEGSPYHFNSPKESGALRRASMDLTRSLAEMRKPG